MRHLRLEPRKQTLGVSAIDRLPVVLRKAGVLDEAIVREFVNSDGGVAAIQDLRNRNDVFQRVQGWSPSGMRGVQIKLSDLVLHAIRNFVGAIFWIVVDDARGQRGKRSAGMRQNE